MAFAYSIPSRTTSYNGIEFRSELEAAWAAYFDLRKIKYEYEPLLNLPFWRPDFNLDLYLYDSLYNFMTGEGESFRADILVEVKPYTTDQWHSDSETIDKIKKSHRQVVLLGINSSVILSNIPQKYTSSLRLYGENPECGNSVEDDWIEAKNTVRWKKNVS